MSLFSFLSRQRKSATTRTPPNARPSVDLLEDRRLLATFTVGAAGSGANFINLQAAIAGAAAGDTILVTSTGTTLGATAAGAIGTTTATLAAGSNSVALATVTTAPKPGDVLTFSGGTAEQLIVSAYNSATSTITFTTNARFTHAASTVSATGDEGIWKQVTITGDPLSSRESISGGNLIIAGGVSKVSISHVNLSGNNLTIDESSTGDTVSDVTALTITDNPYTNAVFASMKSGSNTISSSTVTANVVVHGNTLGTSTGDTITADTILGNVQLFNADGTTLSNSTINGGVDVEGGSSGTIRVTGNTITGTTTATTANGHGTSTAGIVVTQPTPGATPVAKVNVTISGNTITTGTGTAISLSLDTLDQTAGQNFTVLVSGNDLRNNTIGVAVQGDNQGLNTSAGNITVTGNNFKSFVAGSATSFAVSLTGTGSAPTGTPTVKAKGNFFGSSITDETKVVQYSGNGGGTGTITVDNPPLTAAQSAINAIYFDLLGRAADAGGLAYWSSQSQNAVALGILHSPEAEGRMVDSFYAQTLGRSSDASGRAYYVSLLSNGATDETVLTDLLSSTEFYNRAQSLSFGGAPATTLDQRYVAALYQYLLGRSASQSDLTYWSGLLSSNSTQGKAMVAGGIVNSAEFRQRIVTQFYGNTTFPALTQLGFPSLLHRTAAPSANDVSFWVNSTMDIRSIEAFFLGTSEFAANG